MTFYCTKEPLDFPQPKQNLINVTNATKREQRKLKKRRKKTMYTKIKPPRVKVYRLSLTGRPPKPIGRQLPRLHVPPHEPPIERRRLVRLRRAPRRARAHLDPATAGLPRRRPHRAGPGDERWSHGERPLTGTAFPVEPIVHRRIPPAGPAAPAPVTGPRAARPRERHAAPRPVQPRVVDDLAPHVLGQPQRETLAVVARLDQRQRVARGVRPREKEHHPRETHPGGSRPTRHALIGRKVRVPPGRWLGSFTRRSRLIVVVGTDMDADMILGTAGVGCRVLGGQLHGRKEGLAGLGHEVSPADGTGGVRREPRVDAVGVERVAALGDQAERLLVLELVQAHRALQRPFPDLEPLHRRVQERGEGVDDRGVEPAHPPQRPPPEGVLPGGLPALAAAEAPVGALADVDGEEAHEEEGADQDHHDYGHRGVELLAVLERVRRRGSSGRRGAVLGSGGDRQEQEEKKLDPATEAMVGSCTNPRSVIQSDVE